MNRFFLLCTGFFLTFPFLSVCAKEDFSSQISCIKQLEQFQDFSSHVNSVIFFKFDDASLPAHAVDELDVLTEWMHLHPYTNIIIHGYSDVSEAITSENVIRDEEYAVALSKRRAEMVRSVLVERNNISPERIRLIPHNAERSSSYSDKIHNRRVVVTPEFF